METVISKTLLHRTHALSVLYIEDSAVLRHATTKILQNYFNSIDTACDGQEGLGLFIEYRKQHQVFYDIVITDLEMPNMNGYELTKHLLQANPQQEIIITSSHKDVSGLIELINLGITQFLTKPIVLDSLHKMIVHVTNIIHHKQLEREELEELEEYNQILKERERQYLQKLEENLQTLEATNQELQLVNRSKDDFFRNISHEMRTPLNAILGLTSLLIRRHYKDEKLSSSLAIIDRSAQTLHSHVESILDMQNIQNQTLILVNKEFELMRLLNECIELSKQKSLECEINFTHHLDPSLPITFIGDRVRIKKVLTVLLYNAFKFTKAGGDVYLCASYDNNTLHLQVIDTGIGIELSDQDKIFNLFQVDSSLSRQYEGVGIGLSVAKSIITLMQGSITLHSKIGDGSTFLVEIPQASPQ
jgi:signal transduction histidine kinase